MHPFLKKYRLPFSSGSKEVLALLTLSSKRKKEAHVTKASSLLLKKIKKYEADLKKFGLPRHLALAHISKEVGFGIFLKPDAPPLRAGEFVGIYTGELHLVPSEETEGNSYSYDLVEEVPLRKGESKKFSHSFPVLLKEGPFAIKTDAILCRSIT